MRRPVYKNLFKPLNLNGLKLKNRITMAPLYLGYAALGGGMSQMLLYHYKEMAKSGSDRIGPCAMGRSSMAEKGSKRRGSIHYQVQPEMRCVLSTGDAGQTRHLSQMEQAKARGISESVTVKEYPSLRRTF